MVIHKTIGSEKEKVGIGVELYENSELAENNSEKLDQDWQEGVRRTLPDIMVL